MKRNSYNKQGFTLTELMVVIALIGMLTMMAIPAFQAAGRGGNLRTAVFQFNTTLSLARQTAITSRQRVFVVLPDDAPDIPGEKAYRTFAISGQRDGYLSEWRTLPHGVLFDPFENPEGRRNFFLSGGANLNFLEPSIRYPDNSGSELEMFALGFGPDGTIGGAAQAMFYLAEGWVDLAQGSGAVGEIFIREDLPYKGIAVNALTGQTNIREFDR